MSTIYLLVADYDHEGDRVDGCYATEAAAIEAARAVIADDRDYYPSGDEYHVEKANGDLRVLRFPGRHGKSLRVDPWEVEGAAPTGNEERARAIAVVEAEINNRQGYAHPNDGLRAVLEKLRGTT